MTASHGLDRFLPRVAEVMDHAGTSCDAAERRAYVLRCAAGRDRLAFPSLCEILADPDDFASVLGDAFEGPLSAILISVFNGDVSALCGIVERGVADDVGIEALTAMAYLTAEGRLDAVDTAAFLRRLYDRDLASAPYAFVVCWAMAVAFLGERSLRDEARALFADQRLPGNVLGLQGFDHDFRRRLEDQDPMACFHDEGIGPFDAGLDRRDTITLTRHGSVHRRPTPQSCQETQ